MYAYEFAKLKSKAKAKLANNSDDAMAIKELAFQFST